MQPQDGTSILDLGGATGQFLVRIKDRFQARFVVADIEYRFARAVRYRHGFEFVPIEEDKPLPFNDGEFDIVLCNSVIEHVTLPKEMCMTRIPQTKWRAESLRRQEQFASEIRRISKAYFVQTPHRAFPIETHVWLPFVNWLNHDQTMSLVQFTNKVWIKNCRYVDWNLLDCTDMRTLFPEAQIHIERFWGMPKSLIAYYR
jgi:SAM-dependent methyltransferase